MPLDEIASRIASCTACDLHHTRTLTVPGVGDPNANIVFVGEGPGAQEDQTGEPFVGQAGQLLNRLLQDAGLERPEVYILNVVKCRPPGNRDPKPEEVKACKPFLHEQLEVIQPKVIVALGKHAATHLTLHFGQISALMEDDDLTFSVGEKTVPVIACYHPAYLLRLGATIRQADSGSDKKRRAKVVFSDYVERLKKAKALTL